MPEARPQTKPTTPDFATYALGADGAGFARCDTPEAFAESMADTAATGLIVYAAPVGAIAGLLQGDMPADAALDHWRTLARPYLALARRLRRRLTLCQAPHDDAAALSAALAERFPDAPLPDLATSPAPADPFFTAMAALLIARDDETLDMVHNLQARSSGPVAQIPAFDTATATLLARWQDTGGQCALLVDQITGLERDLLGAHGDHDKALRAHHAQAQELVAQIDADRQMMQGLTGDRDAAQQALATAQGRIDTLHAVETDLTDRIHIKNKQIGTLTAERDVARANSQALREQLGHDKRRLEEALAEKTRAFSDQIAAQKARQDQLALEKNALETALAEKTDALAQAQTAHGDRRQMLDHMGEQIAQLENALRIAHVQQAAHGGPELTEEQKQSILGDGHGLHAVLEETAKILALIEQDREQTSQGKEALRQMVRQLETSLLMFQKRQTGTLRALHGENDELKAQVKALYASTSWRVTGPMRSVSRLVRR